MLALKEKAGDVVEEAPEVDGAEVEEIKAVGATGTEVVTVVATAGVENRGLGGRAELCENKEGIEDISDGRDTTMGVEAIEEVTVAIEDEDLLTATRRGRPEGSGSFSGSSMTTTSVFCLFL